MCYGKPKQNFGKLNTSLAAIQQYAPLAGISPGR